MRSILHLTSEQIDQLSCYLELLQKWNRAYNLTAITRIDKMVAYHVLDSLAILSEFPAQGRYLDVGTGAGSARIAACDHVAFIKLGAAG